MVLFFIHHELVVVALAQKQSQIKDFFKASDPLCRVTLYDMLMPVRVQVNMVSVMKIYY